MIYYISLDNPHPSGGVKTQYRHVEILNKHGYPAAMLHQNPGFTAASWFKSTAPIRYNPNTEIRPGDVLVWPEILGSSIRLISGVKNIIFNQNIHYSWRGSFSLQGIPRKSYIDNVDGSMVLTDYESKFIHSLYPDHPVGVVRHGIDPFIFAYDGREKKKQIAFMPRKHYDEAEAVFGWLRDIGTLDGWEVVSIDGSSEMDSARTLQDVGIFFAFGYPEGGSLPPFEALAAGCAVIGYGGFASDDLLSQAGGRVIPSGDTCQFTALASILVPGMDISREASYQRSQQCLGLFGIKQEEDALIKFMKEVKAI